MGLFLIQKQAKNRVKISKDYWSFSYKGNGKIGERKMKNSPKY